MISIFSKCRAGAFLAALLLILSTVHGAEDASGSGWDAGQSAFAKGDYTAAARSFDLAIAQGKAGAEVYYNLAVSQERSGEIAPAVASLLRALAIDPSFVPARNALGSLAAKHQFPIPSPGRADLLVAKFGAKNLWIFGCILAWMGPPLLLVGIFGTKKRALWISLGIAGFLIGKGFLAMAYFGDPLVSARNLAVVNAQGKASLRSSPTDGSGKIQGLPDGSVLDRVSERGRWSYCIEPNGKRGWIPTEELIPVLEK